MKRFHPSLPLPPEREEALATARRGRNRALGLAGVALALLHFLLQLVAAIAAGS